MTGGAGKLLVYGYGNPGRGDDGLGPALAAAVEAMGLPDVDVDANYQLTVEDAAAMNGYGAVIFADAATAGPAPFFFSRIDDSGTGRLGWTSHSVTPVQVMALARDLFASRAVAYTLGIRGYAFGELDEGLSVMAQANLAEAVAFARNALALRQFDHYAQEFGHSAAGLATVGTTGKA
jgi:hydrogenase maturation protease